jgi:hypothetical protein
MPSDGDVELGGSRSSRPSVTDAIADAIEASYAKLEPLIEKVGGQRLLSVEVSDRLYVS